MKYIVCEQPGTFSLKQKSMPKRKQGEALLKVHKIGVCGTDIHAYGGNQAFFTYPRILGHELACEVVEVDEDNRVKVGDQVVVVPYINCGNCIACKNGKTNCCSNIKVIGVHADGGMQEYITVRTDLLLKANHLSHDQMAIVEPLAIGAHALRRANLQKGEYVVVMGCGPIGIGMLKLAQLAGAIPIALDMNPNRLQFVLDEIGIEHMVNVSDNPVEQVGQITGGDFATAVFDATGNQKALESGPDYMAHGGRYVLVGLSKVDLTFNHPKIHAKESSILCSRNATLEDFEYVMNTIEIFPTSSFITHVADFDQMIAQFDSWTKPETGVIKAMIQL
ncbi:zinc-binding alcohol dehydrogenase family protein [Flagellimonas myxillae]|uniref:zinc-binding alcohol dehydrogenase family protein n=1 Tax=Flagellimonas myxillae TaxID=2942214 RepID=UPI00201F6C8A|nr:zinc-binding alcohol dehydrogenase family protein [Muricauda myxillae]MCL6267096.1 zinc-binding alcohol dehydrogenase family protein [Muricauda myxillae]